MLVIELKSCIPHSTGKNIKCRHSVSNGCELNCGWKVISRDM